VKTGRPVSLVALSMLLAAGGCSLGPKSSGGDASKPAEVAQQAAEIQASFFEVPQNQLSHLRIVDVQKAVWTSTIQTTGTVDWDNDHTTQAITQVNGPIARLLVDYGAAVTANQPLLYVSSPDLATAVATYKKARNRQEFSKRTLDRSTDLLDHKVIAQKDLEAAQQDYNDSQAETANDLQALKIFGVSQQEIDDAERQGMAINPQLAVRSPITGVVVQKMVTPGLVIQAGVTACFAISDVSTVWVQGNIYDRDLEAVRTGDTVEVTNASFHETFHGTVNYIGAMIDPDTRTTPIRIVTQNPHDLLKKDMFVEATIHTKSRRNILSVPTSAILHTDDNQPFVYVEVSPGKFAQRLVNVGVQRGDQTEIVSGCKEGERIVAEGSVFLQFANSVQ